MIDATPIGTNVRSTVATYAGVHDDLLKAFARTPQAKDAGLKAGDFSYNTGNFVVPSVMVRASSVLMCSSCPTLTFRAPFVTEGAIHMRSISLPASQSHATL